MHRGVVYNRFKRICPPVLAAIISSIIFGIIHMNFVQGPYAFLVGLAAVYVYERYKSIIAPIILHVTANSVSTIVSIMEFYVRMANFYYFYIGLLIIAYNCIQVQYT